MIEMILENLEATIGAFAVIVTGLWNFYIWYIQRLGKSNVLITIEHTMLKETDEARIFQFTAVINNASMTREYFSNISLSLLGCDNFTEVYNETEIKFGEPIIKNARLFNEKWEWTWVNGSCKNQYKALVSIPKKYIAIKAICKAKYLKKKDNYFIADTSYIIF